MMGTFTLAEAWSVVMKKERREGRFMSSLGSEPMNRWMSGRRSTDTAPCVLSDRSSSRSSSR